MMSTVDENANVPIENKSAKEKMSSPRGKKGNIGGKDGNQSTKQEENSNRQKAAYEDFVFRNKNKKVKKKKNKKKKGNGTANGNQKLQTKETVTANGSANAQTNETPNDAESTAVDGAQGVLEKETPNGSVPEGADENQDHASMVMNVPGARRVSKSRSSILEASKSVKIELQLKQDNPGDHYNFGEEIARGKFAVIKKCTDKKTGDIFAAKLVKYDEDTQELARKEFNIWNGLSHPNLLVLHDAYLVRKYLVLISEIINGVPILDHLGRMEKPTEDDVSGFVIQLLEALEYLHALSIVHLDVKPGNLMIKGNVLKLIDYGSSRKIVNLQGEVGEMVGTAEFMAPEMINFEPISSFTDIWGVGVVTYAVLSGFSPFACEDEDETMASVTALDYRFESKAFASITEEAKSFIKSIIIRIPEKRPAVSSLLEDPWLDESFSESRENSSIDKESLIDLSETLKEQDKLEEVRASTVLKTFIQSPYESPETSENECDGADEDLE